MFKKIIFYLFNKKKSLIFVALSLKQSFYLTLTRNTFTCLPETTRKT